MNPVKRYSNNYCSMTLLLLSLGIFFSGCYNPPMDSANEGKAVSASEKNDEGKMVKVGDDSSGKSGDEQELPAESTENSGFHASMQQNISAHGLTLSKVYDSSDVVEARLVKEYGAVFLTKAMPPPRIMFDNESDVNAFQSNAGAMQYNLSGTTIELQPKAILALRQAEAEAKAKGLSITPRGEGDAARRSFAMTQKLWNGRVKKALEHWQAENRMSDADSAALLAMPIREQVKHVFDLEQKQIFFSTHFDKSILYSVAAPGASQHLSMLALDIKEFDQPEVRKVMANHGWYRTVKSDAPHFTYIGYPEDQLVSRGLIRVGNDDEFWVPDV